MRKIIVLTFTVLVIFFSGFLTRQLLPSKHAESITMKKVTGIGGVFFKCKDREKVKE